MTKDLQFNTFLQALGTSV